MKLVSSLSIAFAAVAFATSAHAQEDADKAPKKSSPPIQFGYQLEGGIASTHMVHGLPKYDTKRIPATEDLAMVRVRNLGPGTLTFGTTFALALDTTVKKHSKSEEFFPMAMYGGRVGPLQVEVGGRVFVFPRMDQARQDIEVIGRVSYPNKYVTPTFDSFSEVSEKKGEWATVGLERRIDFTTWLSIRPRVSYGMQGYELKSERFHAQDVTASAFLTATTKDGFYASLRPAYYYVAGPEHYYKDPSFAGRSTGYFGFMVGSQI